MRAYARPVSIWKLFAILVAVAMLIAPAMTRADAAFAAVTDHHAQMMDAGHCKSPPSSDHGKGADKNCCIAMCTAMAVAPAAPVQEQEPKRMAATFAVPASYLGCLSEIATPPPRLT